VSDLEWRAVTLEEIIQDFTETVRRLKEDKYAFQVGLSDLDFAIDEPAAHTLGATFPLQTIAQAEQALREGAIAPTLFLEDDETVHQVVAFSPTPVGFSGFENCVTHSLALTDQGLFEVGRYPAMNLASHQRAWQWFLHRRLATPEQVAIWQEAYHLSPDQLVARVLAAMTGQEET
jgi:hypothetical protein